LDVGVFFAPRLAAFASLAYGVAIPKLCATASDCESSLGHDVALTMGTRLGLAELGRASVRADVGVGWEWYATTLSDQGVASTRSYSGPVFGSLAASAPVRLGRRFTLGPALGIRAGVFTQASLSTPSWTQATIEGHVVHAWVDFALQAAIAL
jgi:hypothetical protein